MPINTATAAPSPDDEPIIREMRLVAAYYPEGDSEPPECASMTTHSLNSILLEFTDGDSLA